MNTYTIYAMNAESLQFKKVTTVEDTANLKKVRIRLEELQADHSDPDSFTITRTPSIFEQKRVEIISIKGNGTTFHFTIIDTLLK